MGRTVRAGAEPRCSRLLGAWAGSTVSDWSIAAWAVDGEVMLGIPQPGPGRGHLVCRQLSRVDGQLPKWMHRGTSQSKLRGVAVEGGGAGHGGLDGWAMGAAWDRRGLCSTVSSRRCRIEAAALSLIQSWS